LSTRKIVTFLAFFLTGVSAQELRVAAAADLGSALKKIGASFEKQTGAHVDVTLGSSGKLFSQIQSGTPFDVFLSADRSYVEQLQDAGKAEAGTMVLYARGKLVVWIPNGSKLKVSTDDLNALTSSEARKISIADPEHAPYGRAAVAALQHYGIYDQVKPKLVLGENIFQAAQAVQSGKADVGLIALSLALSDEMQRSGHYLVLPRENYSPIYQAAVLLSSAQNKAQARQFIKFLQSSETQKVFHEFGFDTPKR
jgi:molybdate transport system substrate-binding protein